MEDYRYTDAGHTIVERIDTGDVFLASGNNTDPRWIQWQAWIALGGVTQPFAPPTLSAAMQWSEANKALIRITNRLLWRLNRSYHEQTKNPQNTLLDVLEILSDANANKVEVKARVINRKILAGVAGTTLTTTDINAMSNADRRITIEAVEAVCSSIGVSALGGAALSEE